jgi:1,4-alpha-glucan branching enzyme
MAVGTRYKLIFVKNGQEHWRIDPAARDTTHSGLDDPDNGAFVVDTRSGWPPFRTPAFVNLIIYQLHVRSFAGRNDHFAGQVPQGTANSSFLESKLGYIRELGFDAIELLSIQERPLLGL